MSKNIAVFPKLNADIYSAICFESSDIYSTEINSKKVPLQQSVAKDDNREVVLLNPEKEPWSLLDNNLIVQRTVNIKNPSPLFGEQGIACKNAIIGIGLRWSSKESRQRGVYEIGLLKSDSNDVEVSYTVKFEKCFLKSSLSLETIFYIKEKGDPEDSELFLGNKKGLVLGELDFVNIRLDGKGSEFPIFEEDNNDPSNPLWSVNIDWDIPSISSFVDSFQIYLNKKNPNYKFIDKTNEHYDSHLMNEIVSSALTLLVLKLKEDINSWDEMDKNVNLEEGSVSQAVYYFKHHLHMNFDNPVTIHESFRRYYEQIGNKNDS